MKTHKKILSAVLVSLLMFVFAFSCFAQENERVIKTYTEDLGNGITAVVTITETDSLTRSSKTHSITKDYYSSGTYIGAAALTASFYYDGSTARATGAGGAGSGANGWSYGDQSTGTSGNHAYLNATLSNGSHDVPVSLSLTCSPSGSIS
ncbi:hypothetical protein [uncultured Subdoligranulum sp.]|uniref:hypothetical protein n=1 Tax=uncultured Subdoligranulum sp. TaxID=512298 RepID=UPI0026332210|nr:hypothetical protein [uncultured Subdoligranulum sp.]